jgi:hypothetical protein
MHTHLTVKLKEESFESLITLNGDYPAIKIAIFVAGEFTGILQLHANE